jgi:hypothetical protein
MNRPAPDPLASPTNKLLQQILAVSQENLTVTKQILATDLKLLETAESSNESLKQIVALLAGFAHDYTVTVEQVVLAKPRAQKSVPKK